MVNLYLNINTQNLKGNFLSDHIKHFCFLLPISSLPEFGSKLWQWKFHHPLRWHKQGSRLRVRILSRMISFHSLGNAHEHLWKLGWWYLVIKCPPGLCNHSKYTAMNQCIKHKPNAACLNTVPPIISYIYVCMYVNNAFTVKRKCRVYYPHFLEFSLTHSKLHVTAIFLF